MKLTLCNKEHPEYGVATVPFPIPDEEYSHCIEMLEHLEIGGVMNRDCYVDQLMDAPPVLDMLEGTEVNIDELDFLARSIDRYTDEELAKFQSMAAAKGYTDMTDLINLSLCCEQATVITDFSNLEALGKSHYLATHGDCVPVDIYAQLNGEGIARSLIAGGTGQVTPYGVVYDNGMELEQLYTGRSFPGYIDKAYLMELEIDTPHEGAVTLFLPQAETRLVRLLERAGIRQSDRPEIKVWNSDLPNLITSRLDVPHESIFELNRMCAAVQRMDEAQVQELNAPPPELSTLKLYMPLKADVFEYNKYGDLDDELVSELDGSALLRYEDNILAALTKNRIQEEAERGIMHWYCGDDGVDRKVRSVIFTAEERNGQLWGVAQCRIAGELTPEELDTLKDYVSGQASDGWGEGFEQREIKIDEGVMYVHLWNSDSWSIQTEQERFAPKLAEGLPNLSPDAPGADPRFYEQDGPQMGGMTM